MVCSLKADEEERAGVGVDVLEDTVVDSPDVTDKLTMLPSALTMLATTQPSSIRNHVPALSRPMASASSPLCNFLTISKVPLGPLRTEVL